MKRIFFSLFLFSFLYSAGQEPLFSIGNQKYPVNFIQIVIPETAREIDKKAARNGISAMAVKHGSLWMK